jgi:putative ABC transport system permease protein
MIVNILFFIQKDDKYFMLKKINFILSFCIFTLIFLIFSNIFNGKQIEKALYSNVSEIHITYKSDTNYEAMTDELINISSKTNTNVSQYMFTGKNKLNIISTNPSINKYFDLKKGHFPSIDSSDFVSNQNKSTNKNVGILNLPSNHLQINLYSTEHFKNIGFSNVFYVQGDIELVKKVLNKYGAIKETPISKSDTYALNQYHIIIITYLLIFFMVSILVRVFYERKKIVLKKTFGYPTMQIIIDSFKDMNGVLFGLVSSTLIYVLFVRQITMSLLIPLLLSLIIYITFSLIYVLVQIIILHSIKINTTIKGYLPFKAINSLLTLTLFFSLFIGLTIFNKIENNFSEYININLQLNSWKKTENLYKTNLTNQLDRNDEIEEKQYLNRAQNFYNSIKDKYDTFIIAPYNYAIVGKDNNDKAIYVGQDRFYNDQHESIVNMGGLDIFIDLNYLKRNPIEFCDSSDMNKINVNKNTISLLIPEKYKDYEQEIKENYLSYIKFILEEEPPNQKINIANLDINTIYVKNNQKYFTYNYLYGSSEDNYFINDPISIIVNPNMMSGLFWGNILTQDGGLYMEFEDSNNDSVFNKIKDDLKSSNLENTINFTVSAFKDYGTYASKIQASFLNSLLQGIFIICLFFIINLQIISMLFKMHMKKLFLKKILGYSVFYRLFSIIYIPVLTSFIAITSFIVINPNKFNYFLPAFGIVIILNILIYSLLHLQSKKNTIKESLNDI